MNHESLLTQRLSQALAARKDIRAQIEAVDDAEQPLTIARHLMPIIERSIRATNNPDSRAELVSRILSALPDHVLAEELYQREPGRIERLDAVTPDVLGVVTAAARDTAI